MSQLNKIAVMALAGTLGSACTLALAGDERAAGASEFEIATIIVEQNATDGDTEIVMVAKPDSDDGLVKMTIVSPDGRKVVQARSPRNVGGQREFIFESPEPPGDAILAAYPEGDYRFDGRTSTGERFSGSANLSHLMPAATTILFPIADSTIPADALNLQWSSVPEAVEYRIEFENESVDPEQVFTLNVPQGVTSFDVPASLIMPGAEYQVGIATVGDNGNVVGVEVVFSTAE